MYCLIENTDNDNIIDYYHQLKITKASKWNKENAFKQISRSSTREERNSTHRLSALKIFKFSMSKMNFSLLKSIHFCRCWWVLLERDINFISFSLWITIFIKQLSFTITVISIDIKIICLWKIIIYFSVLSSLWNDKSFDCFLRKSISSSYRWKSFISCSFIFVIFDQSRIRRKRNSFAFILFQENLDRNK